MILSSETNTGSVSEDTNEFRAKRQVVITTNQTTTVNDIAIGEEPSFEGIDDPMTCLELGEAILFSISNTSYPVYDVDNLWNTNPDFDYGAYRQLNESQQLTSQSILFAFRFMESGVFSFFLSNDPNRNIFFRVVEETAQCPEVGPFFPATPSRAVQLGIERNDDLLLSPNWLLIGTMLSVAAVLMCILIVALVSHGESVRALLKICRYYSTTMCHYWDMSVK